jgi:hypothetical protein
MARPRLKNLALDLQQTLSDFLSQTSHVLYLDQRTLAPLTCLAVPDRVVRSHPTGHGWQGAHLDVG